MYVLHYFVRIFIPTSSTACDMFSSCPAPYFCMDFFLSILQRPFEIFRAAHKCCTLKTFSLPSEVMIQESASSSKYASSIYQTNVSHNSMIFDKVGFPTLFMKFPQKNLHKALLLYTFLINSSKIF